MAAHLLQKPSARLSLAVGQTKPENLGLFPSVIHAFNLVQQIADFRLERLSGCWRSGDAR